MKNVLYLLALVSTIFVTSYTCCSGRRFFQPASLVRVATRAYIVKNLSSRISPYCPRFYSTSSFAVKNDPHTCMITLYPELFKVSTELNIEMQSIQEVLKTVNKAYPQLHVMAIPVETITSLTTRHYTLVEEMKEAERFFEGVNHLKDWYNHTHGSKQRFIGAAVAVGTIGWIGFFINKENK